MVGGVEAGVCSGGVNCDAEIAAISNYVFMGIWPAIIKNNLTQNSKTKF